MPLFRGKSKAVIAKNIGTLISEGYAKDQAAAIAYKKAGKSRKSSRGK
jgi:hypothetical protein